MNDENKLTREQFESLIVGRNGGQFKTKCPLCNHRRKNKGDRSLSINVDDRTYYCHYCEATGAFPLEENERYMKQVKPEKVYNKPNFKYEKLSEEFDDRIVRFFANRRISVSTLKECKITQTEEYFPQVEELPGVGKKRLCMAFNYFLNGELINAKFRTSKKDFKGVSGARSIPYNIDSISKDNRNDNSVIICEGEIDCLSYVECGFKQCISVPNGANANSVYLNDFIEDYFDDLEIIYVSPDSDTKGLILREELLRRFGTSRCRVVEYPEGCKDINEVLMKYGKEAVKLCIDSAIEIRPDGLQELGDVETELDDMFENGLKRGATIGIDNFDSLISFDTGMIYVVTGVPSHGKTYFLNFILCRLNLLHGWKVGYFSPEFYPTKLHMAQVIETIGGLRFNKENYSKSDYDMLKDHLRDNFYWVHPDDTDINSVLDRIEFYIRRRGIKAFVIDPFNALTDSQRNSQKRDEYISDFMQKIRWFARKHNVAIFIVMHPTKMTKKDDGLYPVPDLYNCKGASEIFDKADFGITAWRNEIDDYVEAHITKVKFRHLGQKGHSTFKFNINNGRYEPIPDAEECKIRNESMRSLAVMWDNRNYLKEKIKSGVKQSDIQFENTYDPISSPCDFVEENGVSYYGSDQGSGEELPF